jgi:hypothetical protein
VTRIVLFKSEIGDGPTTLTLAVTRNFDSSDPFTIAIGADEWSMTATDAERLAACGRRLEGALDWAAQHGEPVKLGPFFQRHLGFADGSASKFEVGLDELGGHACAYLEWANKRALDGSGRLLKALSTLGEATTTIRQTEASRHIQDIKINAQNFRSSYGWDGQ